MRPRLPTHPRFADRRRRVLLCSQFTAPEMNQKKQALCIFFICVFALGSARAEEKDDDDDDSLATFVDTVNLIMYLLAGGPEEIVLRIFTIVVLMLVSVLIFGCLAAVGLYEPDRRRDNVDRAVGWGVRGFAAHSIASEFFENLDRWVG